jgi:hypothetical protein
MIFQWLGFGTNLLISAPKAQTGGGRFRIVRVAQATA